MHKIYIPAKFIYEEGYIPPRCKNTRYRETEAICKIYLTCITPDEAPTAFLVKDGKSIIDCRYFKDNVYVRVKASSRRAHAEGWWDFEELKARIEIENTRGAIRIGSGYEHNIENCRKYIHNKYSDYLIIDNYGDMEVWVKTGEPRYVVMTFGLGNNHGSTNYFVEFGYNENLSKKAYFNALQHEEAKKFALKIAWGRGDTESVPRIKEGPVIDVWIPEAVKIKPNKLDWK